MNRFRKFCTEKNPVKAIEPTPNMRMNRARVTRMGRFLA